MAKKLAATHLTDVKKASPKVPVIGVFATSDPRIDDASRRRCRNIAKMAADVISGAVVMPDKTPVPVVYSTVLVDGEAQADIVAQQFRDFPVPGHDRSGERGFTAIVQHLQFRPFAHQQPH